MTAARQQRQRGAATLVVALGLLVAASGLVLSVARTRLTEQRLTGNDIRHLREHLAAQALLEHGIARLAADAWRLDWPPATDGWQRLALAVPAGLADAGETALGLARRVAAPALVRVRSRAGGVRMEQWVRPLGILSPAGERAPPLLSAGCPAAASGAAIYPRGADGPQPAAAVWSFAGDPCRAAPWPDLHGGTVRRRKMPRDGLWPMLFSVDREAFQALADADAGRPWRQRRYLWAGPGDLAGGAWTRSLGSSERPVALVFPAGLGCPPLAAGVRITGVVFYGGDCSGTETPGAGARITGTLAFAGRPGRPADTATLLHVSEAAGPRPALPFPTLRAPRLPGSWADFR